MKAGLRGLVCSPLEIVALRKILPAQIQLVTPGIRTGAEKADDQKRTLTPREAIAGRRKLAGDWPADLRRGKSARGGGENFEVVELIQTENRSRTPAR